MLCAHARPAGTGEGIDVDRLEALLLHQAVIRLQITLERIQFPSRPWANRVLDMFFSIRPPSFSQRGHDRFGEDLPWEAVPLLAIKEAPTRVWPCAAPIA